MAKKIPKVKSEAEETLWFYLKHCYPKLPWVREHRFDKVRRWRFDFALVEAKIAVEVEGVSPHKFTKHTSFKGYERDCEKYNAAAVQGWRVLRGTQAMVKSGKLMETIDAVLKL